MFRVYQRHLQRNQKKGKLLWILLNTRAEQVCQNSAELVAVRVFRNPTTIVTANGEMRTNENATVYVNDLDLFVAEQILEDTSAVLSLGKRLEYHAYSFVWNNGPKKHLKKMLEYTMQHVLIVVPGFTRTVQLVYEYTLNIGIAGLNARLQVQQTHGVGIRETSCEVQTNQKQK